MTRSPVLRQRVRKALLIISFLLFPITMNYLSPYVIIDGASQGIINGSFISFGLMFAGALFLGRLWCGWACPAGGLAEIAFDINAKPVNSRKIDWIKWAIWIPWIAIIAWAAISAGGYHRIDPFLDTQGGISVAGDADRPIIAAYFFYYLVILIFLLLSVFAGRRAGCHTICWMAPFMILGRKLRNLFNWPALRLKAETSRCTDCKKCTSNCPMSLDVNGMVHKAMMEDSECILCGSCIDGCQQKVIKYTFSTGK
jgi:ferredoxin-type protein NapH